MWNMKRHKATFALLTPSIRFVLKCKYGYKATMYKMKKDEPCIIISNHVATHDVFFLPSSFKRPIHFISSEAVLNHKLGKIVKYLVAPIATVKGAVDIKTMLDCKNVLKAGGAVGIFSEANRSFSGELCYVSRAVIKLIRLYKVPVLLYRIDGGTGVDPRWCKIKRSGKCTGAVVRRLELEEYQQMTDDELYSAVISSISYDDVAWAEKNSVKYKCKNRAEFLERALYYCPYCQSVESMVSDKHKLSCVKCGIELEYTEKLKFKMLTSGKELLFDTVPKWYKHQELSIMEHFKGKMNSKDCVYSEDGGEFSCYEKGSTSKKEFGKASLRMYIDRYEVETKSGKQVFMINEITALTPQFKNILLIVIGDTTYSYAGNERMSALKFIHAFYCIKHHKGENDGKFMGH